MLIDSGSHLRQQGLHGGVRLLRARHEESGALARICVRTGDSHRNVLHSLLLHVRRATGVLRNGIRRAVHHDVSRLGNEGKNQSANLHEGHHLLDISINGRTVTREEQNNTRRLQVLAELFGLNTLEEGEENAYVLNSAHLLLQVVLFSQICALFDLQEMITR